MSYSTPNDFILINKINIEYLSKYLFKNDKILTDSINNDTQELIYIKYYIENLLNTDRIDATINNLFNNKVYYYKLLKENPDKFIYTENIDSEVIDIDLSFYTNENIKKYMFIYNFLSEYYKIISNIKKNKYFIDNETIYNHQFEIQMKYILLDDIQGNSKITNVLNYNNKISNYTILFKLEDQNNKTNKNKIIQPNGSLFDIKLKLDNKNLNITNDTNNIYVNSFIKLFNQLINKEDLKLDDTINEYILLSKSYKYQFENILLNYYILKTIYFYLQLNHITKTKEIDHIITSEFPIIFNNFNNKINDKNNDSLINILENSKIKSYNIDYKKNEKIKDIKNKIKYLESDNQNIIDFVKNNKNNTNITTDDILLKQKKARNNNIKIKNLEEELYNIENNKYITTEGNRIQEAIEYKNELAQINKKIENNKTSLDIINKNVDYDKKYLNNINIFFYFANFILITVLFTFIINTVTNSVNISIPIIIFLVSITLYIIINNIIKNIYINQINGTTYTDNSTSFILNNLYNYYSEKFQVDDYNDNSYIYDNITELPNIINNQIDNNLDNILYISIPNSNYKINVIEQTLFNNSCLSLLGSSPSTSNSPLTSTSPNTACKKVDLPAPLGPIRPII